MTQEEKDLLLKDLCGRLPYRVKISVDNEVEILEGLGILDNVAEYGSFLMSDIEEVKPYLFPLSSMTEEQRKEMEENCLKFPQSGVLMPTYKTFDFFNKHHIDFRGLIEQGLANDATGLNIY
jgi:hypothetical protein